MKPQPSISTAAFYVLFRFSPHTPSRDCQSRILKQGDPLPEIWAGFFYSVPTYWIHTFFY